MLYNVVHETLYSYSELASISHNLGHLLPLETDRQKMHRLQLRIDPVPATVESHQDYFGNKVVFFTLLEPHQRLSVRTDSRVEVLAPPPIEPSASPPWEEVVASIRHRSDSAGLHAREMIWESPFVSTGAPFADYARPSFSPRRPIADALVDLNRRIHAEFRYDPEATTLATPILEVLEDRHGVCQDFAHLMIGCLRSLGLPARYASGYIRSADPKPPAKPPRAAVRATPDEPPASTRRTPPDRAREVAPGADAEDALVGSEASHAWVSAWCPPYGWLDLDPTNDVVPSDQHVLLAYGRDYDDVSPLKGVTLGGGAHTVTVRVDVRPVAASDARPIAPVSA